MTSDRVVLILPSGIETQERVYALEQQEVLIVPSGIETSNLHALAYRERTY